MVDVDLEAYLGREATPRDGVRLMQWSNYVRRRIPQIDSKAELLMLDGDAMLMGSADWWYKP